MNNILITSSSGKVSLVKRYKKAAANYNDVEIYTADLTDEVPTSLFSDRHFLLPKDNDVLYKKTLFDIILKNEIKMIVPTRDEELLVFSSLEKELKEIGCRVLAPSEKTVRICFYKNNFFKFCQENDISVPKTYSLLDDKQYPIFIKPIIGKASVGVRKIETDQEFQSLKNKDELIVQEFIDWQEYTIDLFCDFESNIVSIVPRKRLKIINGESYIAETEKNNFIIEKVKDLSNKLKLVGHNVIQCFYKNNDIKFIEVNLRYGGSSNLSFESGANIPEFVLKLLKNDLINYEISDFKDSLKTFRYMTDSFKNNETFNKTFCVDIDGTICSEGTKYENARPIKKVVDKINRLYENNTIILHTARGYKSRKDWRQFTENQLKEWGVKYHKLIMDKPYADYYIDNKAIDVLDWV